MKRTNQPKRLIFLSLFICICTLAVYADRVRYSYDAAGNRTESHLVPVRGNGKGQANDTLPRHDRLAHYSITIYPNPTDGKFSVEITGIETLENGSITLFNMQGGIVYSNTDPDATNDIDLTQSPDGMYLLVIRLDGETSIWKVIKI